jgi:mannose-6-phosphate isomerase
VPGVEAVPLIPSFHERVWGATDLAPWFAAPAGRTGEVWFTLPGQPLPLLIKFLFTTGKLSVQLHPDDAYARAHHDSPGKSEMWYVLRAAPGAAIGAGLRERVSKERLREASVSGEIERLMVWHPASAGDVFFIPAGTIHALGPNLAVCEIQQNSGITYRLYDYGRPRELHLEQALEVAVRAPHEGRREPRILAPGVRRLVECPHFAADLVETGEPFEQPLDPRRVRFLAVLEGRGRIGAQAFEAGSVWMLPSGEGALGIHPAAPSRIIRACPPGEVPPA